MSFARSKAKIYADDEVKVRFSDVAGVDEAEDELKEIVEFLKNPKKYTEPRRAHSQGRAARRPSGNRQDAARAGRGRRGSRAVLQPERIRVRGDVRGRRRGPDPRSVPAVRSQGALHRVHRRARRARQGARAEPDRQPRGTRADAQPAAGRDGRVRRAQGRHHHGRDEPARGARSCPAPARPVRSPGPRRQTRCEGPRGHSADPREEREGVARTSISRSSPPGPWASPARTSPTS